MAALVRNRPLTNVNMHLFLARRNVAGIKPWCVLVNNMCHQCRPLSTNEHRPSTSGQKGLNSALLKQESSGCGRKVGYRWMSVRSGHDIDFKLLDHHEYKFRFMFRPMKFFSSVMKAMAAMSQSGTQFDMKEFLLGAKQAIVHISSLLAAGEFNQLTTLVNPETVEKLKANYYRLSAENRALLAADTKDILSLFVYEMRVHRLPMEKKTRIEADVVASYSYIGRQYKSMFTNPLLKAIDTRSTIVCNYTFVRLFPDKLQPFDSDEGWTVDKLNHFKILSLLNEMDGEDIPPKKEE